MQDRMEIVYIHEIKTRVGRIMYNVKNEYFTYLCSLYLKYIYKLLRAQCIYFFVHYISTR